MSDDTSNIVLEHLRALRVGQDALREDMREVKSRLAVLEAAYGSLSLRIDRIEQRLDRIERRLGLVDVG